MLGVFAAGRILNAKTARSQVLGGMIWGVGAALTEDGVVDPRHGHFVNHDLAEYHVPVHADIPAIDAVFLPEVDDKANPLKIKGIGELGISGAGAAVANAVFNACGRARARLPDHARQGAGRAGVTADRPHRLRCVAWCGVALRGEAAFVVLRARARSGGVVFPASPGAARHGPGGALRAGAAGGSEAGGVRWQGFPHLRTRRGPVGPAAPSRAERHRVGRAGRARSSEAGGSGGKGFHIAGRDAARVGPSRRRGPDGIPPGHRTGAQGGGRRTAGGRHGPPSAPPQRLVSSSPVPRRRSRASTHSNSPSAASASAAAGSAPASSRSRSLSASPVTMRSP